MLAGGAPPWAPAHGYRRKHGHRHTHEHDYHYDEHDHDEHHHQVALAIGGTIVGVMIGGAIGRSMDEADHVCGAHTLEQAPPDHAVTWSDTDGARYRVVPRDAYEAPGPHLPGILDHGNHRRLQPAALRHRLPRYRRPLAACQLRPAG